MLLKNSLLHGNVKNDLIIDGTEGFTGAHVEQIVRRAINYGMQRDIGARSRSIACLQRRLHPRIGRCSIRRRDIEHNLIFLVSLNIYQNENDSFCFFYIMKQKTERKSDTHAPLV
jgi:SpoVK/Ycf46/Vps4 family AAA+-type ATPase